MIKKQVFIPIIAMLMSFIGIQTIYAQMIDGVEKVSSVEGITEYRLKKNGFKFLLFPDNSKPTITVNITYLVGSRMEGYGETGMAHLLEHLLFKGSNKHPNISNELTSHGARPNGTTWLDRTNYFETFAATDENLEWALDLESDRMVNSFVAKKDLESEMSVVRNEFEMGENDPGSILSERVGSTAYLWHNYGKSTIGARSDIENVPIERLQAFYKKYYQPDNSVLLVAGKIDVNKTIALVKKYFENIPLPDRNVDKLYDTYTREPTQDGERFVELRRSGDIQVVDIVYHVPPALHRDFAAIDVLMSILSDNPNGILYKDLVQSNKATSVFAWGSAGKEPGLVEIMMQVPMDKSLEEAKNILLTRLNEIPKMTFDQKDLDRQKQKEIKSWELLFNNVERVGTYISEFIAKGDWRLMFLARDYTQEVTLDDLKHVAEYYFKPSNRTVGTFIPDKNPERAEIPDEINVEALVKDYKGKEVVAIGEDFDPSPMNIDNRTIKSNASNGLELALLPKETRGDNVVANMTFRLGDLNSLQNKSHVGSITAQMLNKGTKTKTKQQIIDELDQLKARVNFYGGPTSINVSIQATKENLPAVLDIVNDILKNPSFPKEEFDILVSQSIADIESQKSDPQAIAGLEFARALETYPKSDPRYNPTFEEDIEMTKTVTLDALKSFHKDFYGASSGTISVVGDFDKPTIEAKLKSQYGNWVSKTKFKRIENKYAVNKAGEQQFNTPDKANALYLAGITENIKDSDPDYAAMLMANYIFGGGFLSSRLATRIRQKDGLSYGVGSGFNASALDKKGSFTIYAISAPENSAKVHAAVKEEIDRIHKEGFTQSELDEARKGYLQSRQVNRSQDGSLSNTLNNYLYLDRTMKYDESLEKTISNLTLDQINAAFKKYVDSKKLTVIMAGDFEKAKASKP